MSASQQWVIVVPSANLEESVVDGASFLGGGLSLFREWYKGGWNRIALHDPEELRVPAQELSTEDLTNLVTSFSHPSLNVNFGAERGIAHSEVIVPAQTSIPQDLMHMWEANRVGLTDHSSTQRRRMYNQERQVTRLQVL